jgi:hypothetical protein
MPNGETSILLVGGTDGQPQILLVGNNCDSIDKIRITSSNSSFEYALAPGLSVSTKILDTSKVPFQLKPIQDLIEDSARLLYDEFWTRVARLSIKGTIFLGASTIAGKGWASLAFGAHLEGTKIVATLEGMAKVAIGGSSVAVQAAVKIRDSGPTLSLSIFDGLFRLPDVPFPNLQWGINPSVAGPIGRFIQLPFALPITATAKPQLTVNASVANGDLTLTATAPNIDLQIGTTPVGHIPNFSINLTAGAISFAGVLNFVGVSLPALPDMDIHGLRIAVSQISIPTATLDLAAPGLATGTIKIGSLEVYPVASQSDRLVAAFDLAFDLNEVRVENAQLIAPSPAQIAFAVLRQIGKSDIVIRSIAGVPPLGPPNPQSLFRVLAKILSAILRTGNAIAGGAASALVALAGAIDKLFEALTRTLQSPSLSGLGIQILLDSRTHEPVVLLIQPVRQIPAPIEISTPLLRLQCDGATTPAFLMDRRNGRTLVGIVALANMTANAPLATLSTDLWLSRPAPGANNRELERLESGSKTGARASDPLLSIRFSSARPGLSGLLIGGLAGGQGIGPRSLISLQPIMLPGAVTIIGLMDDVAYGELSQTFTVEFDAAADFKDRVLPFLPQGPVGSASDDFFAKLRQRVKIDKIKSRVQQGDAFVEFDVSIDLR